MSDHSQSPTVLGHPPGLFTLFFAEMWERFSYYGMRALLLFYMIKGFLGYGDEQAYAVYGAYTGLVYATPFIGGMLADRLLGQRLAVVIGGLLMAAGHVTMTVENESVFFIALALLILGNGFFKPNISSMVGSLYPKASGRKDAAFTIFYMGINLGAAISPVLCGYVGETYGWHYGFGLATIGMLIGVAIFVAPTKLTQALIMVGAVMTAVSMTVLQDSWFQLAVRLFLGVALTISAAIAFKALGKGGIPDGIGAPPEPERLTSPASAKLKSKAPLVAGMLGLAAVASIVISQFVLSEPSWKGIALAVSLGFIAFVPWASARAAVYLCTAALIPTIAVILQQGRMAGYVLAAFGVLAFGSLIGEALRAKKVERERMFVVLILTFFSIVFWAFFEQAGSSMNNFADRNVDRVVPGRLVTQEDVGKTISFRVPLKTSDAVLNELPVLTQEQLGFNHGEGPFNMSTLSELRDAAQKSAQGVLEAGTEVQLRLDWPITEEHIGMGIGGSEVPASEFQAANAIFILIFGLILTAIWGFLSARGREPSTPFKFALGILQLGLGFAALWYGASIADERGMVGVSWLLVAYLLHTTGELCLSPVGLSMVTKLSPKRLVSTVMGAWFLATAFSNFVASLIAGLTGVSEGGEEGVVPPPQDTVAVYGDVFGKIGITAIVAALICFALVPLLKQWMHIGAENDGRQSA